MIGLFLFYLTFIIFKFLHSYLYLNEREKEYGFEWMRRLGVGREETAIRNIIFLKFCFQKKKKVYKVESHLPLASYMLVHTHVHTPTYIHMYKHVHTHTIHIDTQNSDQVNFLLIFFK